MLWLSVSEEGLGVVDLEGKAAPYTYLGPWFGERERGREGEGERERERKRGKEGERGGGGGREGGHQVPANPLLVNFLANIYHINVTPVHFLLFFHLFLLFVHCWSQIIEQPLPHGKFTRHGSCVFDAYTGVEIFEHQSSQLPLLIPLPRGNILRVLIHT